MSLLSSHVTNHPVIRLAPSLTQSVTARVTGLMPLFDRAIAKSQTEKGESREGWPSLISISKTVQWGVAVEGCR